MNLAQDLTYVELNPEEDEMPGTLVRCTRRVLGFSHELALFIDSNNIVLALRSSTVRRSETYSGLLTHMGPLTAKNVALKIMTMAGRKYDN